MEIGEPQIGFVICHEYLWHVQRNKGMDNGLKGRPCLIVLSGVTVKVSPITHTPPEDPSTAVQIPAQVVLHLGLTGDCWIICTELNEFKWTGTDLRPVPGKTPATTHYGPIPPKLLQQVAAKILFFREGKKLRIVNRD